MGDQQETTNAHIKGGKHKQNKGLFCLQVWPAKIQMKPLIENNKKECKILIVDLFLSI